MVRKEVGDNVPEFTVLVNFVKVPFLTVRLSTAKSMLRAKAAPVSFRSSVQWHLNLKIAVLDISDLFGDRGRRSINVRQSK
jgi:hypothetical protein